MPLPEERSLILEDADQAVDLQHSHLYRTALKEHQSVSIDKIGGLYYRTLWASISPAGNIYRLTGCTVEKWANIENIWSQVDELADKYASVLGGTQVPHEDRVDVLVGALKNARVVASPHVEEGVVSYGFLPLEEFLDERVSYIGPFVLPVDGRTRFSWIQRRMVAMLVCCIQVIGPLVIFMSENADSNSKNRLKNDRAWREMLQYEEVICLGRDMTERLHTIMGVLMLELVLLILHSYIRDQRDNAKKTGLLPMCTWWCVLGDLTNMWCCVLTVLVIPVLLWGEDTPTGTAMDSLTLLFIFCLDDFAGYANAYTGLTDSDFQRAASWQKAMLSQCPVIVEDLIDPRATTAEGLWRIAFDSSGRLLKVPSAATNEKTRGLWGRRDSAQQDDELCPRRLERIKDELLSPTESSPLLRDPSPAVVDDSTSGRLAQGRMSKTELMKKVKDAIKSEFAYKLRYRVDPRKSEVIYPVPLYEILAYGWHLLDWLFLVLQIVLPIIWMIVNKPCTLSLQSAMADSVYSNPSAPNRSER